MVSLHHVNNVSLWYNDHVNRKIQRISAYALWFLLILPSTAIASHISVDTSKWGFDLEPREIIKNIADFLRVTAVPVGTAVFVLGAFFYVISVGNEERKGTGKKFMIGSIVGVVIVMAAQVLVNFVLHFVYSE
jgi:hypothetical protein